MQTIITTSDLRAAIVELEIRQASEGILLKEQALLTYESIKPINIIKNIFEEAGESHDVVENLINSSVGLSAGYLSKFLFQGISGGPIRKILGTALMFGVKKLVAHNPETVKTWGRVIFKMVKNLLHEKDNKARTNETWETTGQ
jgi:hypothetical protein